MVQLDVCSQKKAVKRCERSGNDVTLWREMSVEFEKERKLLTRMAGVSSLRFFFAPKFTLSCTASPIQIALQTFAIIMHNRAV